MMKIPCSILVLCFTALEVLSQPVIPAFVPIRPTIDKLKYNDRATTGEIEAGPLEAQFFFLPDSTHLVLWTADRDVENYDQLGFTTISSPRYIVYNWHTGLPVAMCPSTFDYTDRWSKAWQQYELRMQYCKNPLEMFCKPDELPEVDKSLKKYLHDYTKIGNDQWASAWHKTESAHSVAYAEMGNFYNGDMRSTQKRQEFPNAIQYSNPAICPGLPVCAVLNLYETISYEDHNLRATVDIINIETGKKIVTLVNWREYKKYQDDSLAKVEKAKQDSIEHAEKLAVDRADLQRRKELLPYFNIAAEKKLTALQNEGWKVEKQFRGNEVWCAAYGWDRDTSNFSKYQLQLQPGRVYMSVVLTHDRNLGIQTKIRLNEVDDENLDTTYWGGELISLGHITYFLNLSQGDTLGYLFSRAAYVQKPFRAMLYSNLECFSCENDEIAPGNKRLDELVITILSKPKPASKTISSKAFPGEAIEVVNLQQPYDDHMAAAKAAMLKQQEEEAAQKKAEQEKILNSRFKVYICTEQPTESSYCKESSPGYTATVQSGIPNTKLYFTLITSTYFGDNAITFKVYKQISSVRKDLLQSLQPNAQSNWNMVWKSADIIGTGTFEVEAYLGDTKVGTTSFTLNKP